MFPGKLYIKMGIDVFRRVTCVYTSVTQFDIPFSAIILEDLGRWTRYLSPDCTRILALFYTIFTPLLA